MKKNDSTFEFERLLGRAVLALWPNLSQDVQETSVLNGLGERRYHS